LLPTGVEGGDVEGGGVEGGRVEGGGAKVGQPDGAKPNFTVIRVSRRRGTPFIPGTLVVSAYVIQPIPKISFMVSVDVIQPIPIIFCIGWLTSTDTNKARPINTAHTPLFRPSTEWRWLLF
jgi:hypothetical protein